MPARYAGAQAGLPAAIFDLVSQIQSQGSIYHPTLPPPSSLLQGNRFPRAADTHTCKF